MSIGKMTKITSFLYETNPALFAHWINTNCVVNWQCAMSNWCPAISATIGLKDRSLKSLKFDITCFTFIFHCKLSTVCAKVEKLGFMVTALVGLFRSVWGLAINIHCWQRCSDKFLFVRTPPHLSPSLLSSSSLFSSLPLEVGPFNPARGSGEAL